jgi:regulator of nucleoside diphosphate kinase
MPEPTHRLVLFSLSAAFLFQEGLTMRSRSITISSTDYQRLLGLLNSARLDRRVPVESVELLEHELTRAAIVDPADLPAEVVAMYSTVWFRDTDTDEVERYTLVYPPEADVLRDRISVLAPIGTALLGFRVGDIVKWRVPSGTRRFEIVDVVQAAPELKLDETAVLA